MNEILNFTRTELESRIISMSKFRLSVMEEFEIKLMKDWLLLRAELFYAWEELDYLSMSGLPEKIHTILETSK